MALAIDLSGKTAVVTGASRGIGRAIALALAEAGANVVVNYRDQRSEARKVIAEVARRGSRGVVLRADVSSMREAMRLMRGAVRVFGGIDILVNNAGIWEEAEIQRMTDADLARMLAINLVGAFNCCRAAAPHLLAQDGGRIILISSTAAWLGEPLHSHYAASKGGLESLARSLAVELGPRRILVNTVAPGWTVTDMTEVDLRSRLGRRLVGEIPLRKVAMPEDVAGAVVFLASPLAGHITGEVLTVDGGYRFRR